MFLKGILLTVLLVVLVIMMIVFFIMALVKRKNTSLRNRLFFVSGGMFIFSLFTGGYLLYRTMQAIKYYGKEFGDTGVEFLSDVLSSSHTMDSPHMKKLLAMQPEGVKIPKEYYTYAGFRDYYRMPLVYPYSLNAIDDMETASIDDETGVRILMDSNNSKHILYNIITLKFNSRALLVAMQDFFDEEADKNYAILFFETGLIEKYTDEKDAIIAAEAAGLDEEEKLWTIKEYYNAFSNWQDERK